MPRLAYAMAERLGASHPFSFKSNSAGNDWLKHFSKFAHPSTDNLHVITPDGHRIKRGFICMCSLDSHFFT